MGFPLSTDIFGQLKWLVKQVKLLVYRVTKIEQGGGGGAQNINQVLATGNTATDKTLKILNTTQGTTELFGNYLKVEGPTGISAYTTYAYQQIGMLTGTNTSVVIGYGATTIDGISVTNGSSQFTADYNQTTLSSVNISTGNSNSFLSTSAYLQFTETDSSSNSLYAYYGRSQISMYDSVSTSTLNIGRVEGYLAQLGFTISNGAGDSVSCDPTQYVITSSTATNKLTVNGLSAIDSSNTKNVGLNLDPVHRTISTIVDNTNYGFFFDQPNGTCIIGVDTADYFGIDTVNHRLKGSSSLLQNTTIYSNPAGFVEIFINGQQYWIELWN